MRRPKIGTLITLLVVGGLIGGGVWWWVKSHKSVPLRYETATVEKRKLVAKVTASGTLSALVTVQVGAQVSGRLAEILVDFNSPVKKGQVIAKLDPQLFEAAVEQSKANYLKAVADLQKAKVQAEDATRVLRRQNELFAEKLVAAQDRDSAQANADAAQAAVASAQAALAQASASKHQAEINLQYTTIHSPIDGVVISRNVDVGQTVASSLQVATLFTIAEDPKKMQVDTNVAEADVGRLTPGMAATFTVDAYPAQTFPGTVRQIRNAPQTVQNVVTYDAVIDVDNAALKLKPGMTATVTFVYAQKDNVVAVPNSALRFRPPAEAMPPGMQPTSSGGRRRVQASADGVGGGRRAAARDAGVEVASSEADGPGPASRPAMSGAGEPPSAVSGASEARGRRGAGGDDGGGGGDRRTVWLLKQPGNRLVPARIQTGISDGTFTEVVNGLEGGEQVVTDVIGGKSQGAPAPGGGPPRGMGRVL